MYSYIPKHLIENIPEFYALMVSLVCSDQVLSRKINNTNINLADAEELLRKEEFIEVIPDKKITLRELVDSMPVDDTAFVILSHSRCVGVLNKFYYDYVDSGSMFVEKYYVSHTKAHNIKYKCIQCGNCCKGHDYTCVLAKEEEIKKIAQDKNKNIESFAYPIKSTEDQNYYSIRMYDHKCIFLDSNNKCKIYDTMPYNCKVPTLVYLFIRQFGMGHALFRCPGIGHDDGETYTIHDINAEVEKYLSEYPIYK